MFNVQFDLFDVVTDDLITLLKYSDEGNYLVLVEELRDPSNELFQLIKRYHSVTWKETASFQDLVSYQKRLEYIASLPQCNFDCPNCHSADSCIPF